MKEAKEMHVVWDDITVNTFVWFTQYLYTGDYDTAMPGEDMKSLGDQSQVAQPVSEILPESKARSESPSPESVPKLTDEVADMIIQDQSSQRILDVRGKLYELLAHCIPPTVILKVSPSEHVCGIARLSCI